MGKINDLIELINDQVLHPASDTPSQLAFYLARAFAKYPGADPEDYSDEIAALCDELSLDAEEMLILIASKIDSVNLLSAGHDRIFSEFPAP